MRFGSSSARSSSRRAGVGSRAGLPRTPRPRDLTRVIFVTREPNSTPFTRTPTLHQSAADALAQARSTSRLRPGDVVRMVNCRGIKEASRPSLYSATLTQDFARHQVSIQQRSNFHTSSHSPLYLANTKSYKMVANTVNKTNLHPSGVAYVTSLSGQLVLLDQVLLTLSLRPNKEHTEIEESLHDKAHIDYDRVAIVSLPRLVKHLRHTDFIPRSPTLQSLLSMKTLSSTRLAQPSQHPAPSQHTLVRKPAARPRISAL